MVSHVFGAVQQQAMRIVSPEAGAIVGFGNRRAWNFRLMGRAPLPTHPVFANGWWLVPVEQDTSLIPRRAVERVQAVYQAGLRPRGFIVAHEAPKLLAGAAKPQQQASSFEPVAKLKDLLTARRLGAVATAALAVLVGPLLVKLLVALVVGIVSALALPILLVGVVLVDPVLIAVTEDGCWVEIDRWNV